MEEIVTGIILKTDYGFGLSYSHPEKIILELVVMLLDSTEFCHLYFQGDNIKALLNELGGDYKPKTIGNLIHQTVHLKVVDSHGMPVAIKTDYLETGWIPVQNKEIAGE